MLVSRRSMALAALLSGVVGTSAVELPRFEPVPS
jgi:hypothetical protein